MEIEKTRYTLYKHKCKENNKVYIGLTNKSDPEDRWKDGKGYKSNYELYSDILKYGWEEGFDHEIIRDDLTWEEAKEAEASLVKIYQATNSEKGYNNRAGGIGYGSYRSSLGIGEKIKALRKHNHETQQDLANSIGQERSTIACYENDSREPPLIVLNLIAKHYSVGLDYFGTPNQNISNDVLMRTIDYFKNSDVDKSEKMSLFNDIVLGYSKYVLMLEE